MPRQGDRIPEEKLSARRDAMLMSRSLSSGIAAGVLLVGVALDLTGCASTPPGYVAREWSLAIRELGITPVFPPREDLQVGDIYMAPSTPEREAVLLDEKGFVPLGLWVGTVKVDDPLEEFYRHRDNFPPTPPTGTSQPTAPGTNIFSSGDTSRLRIVGFPMFMSATFNQGSLSGLVPVEAVSVAFGVSLFGSKTITVSVPRAESYGLPAASLYNLLVPTSSSHPNQPKIWTGLAAGGLLPEDLASYLPAGQLTEATKDPGWNTKKYAYLRVITEVFYARELDVAIDSTEGRGLAADVQPVVIPPVLPGGTAPLSGVLPTAVGGTPTTGEGTPASGAKGEAQPTGTASAPSLSFKEATPQQLAAELNRQLDEATQRRVPGGGARFVAVGKRGISLRLTYERPVAIGYRGMLLKLYENGKVEGAGSGGSPVPTAKPK
jgi:hypothetical protein